MKLNSTQKFAYGIGAIGKDMVYALTASYVMYYYQDVLGLSATFVGFILMLARVFDAANDPLTGIFVAKTNTKWGRFRPWLFCGTIVNAFVLYALFAAPAYSSKASLMVYFAVAYIMWGTTYDFMDIPFWSMIPAVTTTPADRENLSVVGRTCAGVGNAIIAMFTLKAVEILGGANEREGFKWFALIVAVIFVVTEVLCTFLFKEQHDYSEKDDEPVTIPQMLKTLVTNDQAMIVALTIIMINMALYLTSNFIIYFFKYDFGGQAWRDSYTLFSTYGGGLQIIGMMLVYPLLRKTLKLSNEKIFQYCIYAALLGYALILAFCLLGFSSNIICLLASATFVFAANGILTILTTVFLSGSVDYGELKNGSREESVIFSMQTFVVKAASGVAVFFTGLGLDLIGLARDTETVEEVIVTAPMLTGLRMMMTVLPILGLLVALYYFNKRFKLTDAYCEEMSKELQDRKNG